MPNQVNYQGKTEVKKISEQRKKALFSPFNLDYISIHKNPINPSTYKQ